MSGIKREREEETDEDDNPAAKRANVEEMMEEDATPSSRIVGRVRKKSAKVLEMEEFEEAEKKQYKKTPDSSKKAAPVTTPSSTIAKKIKIKTEEITVKLEQGQIKTEEEDFSSPEPPIVTEVKTPTVKKSGKSSVIKLLLSSPAVPTVPSVSTKTVTKSKAKDEKADLSPLVTPVTSVTKKLVKSKIKIKDMTSPPKPAAIPADVPLKVKIETVPNTKVSTTPELSTLTPQSTIYTNMPEIGTISPTKDSSLKIKLILSPKQESPAPEFIIPPESGAKSTTKKTKKKKEEASGNEPISSSSKSPSEAMPNLAALVNAANQVQVKKKTQSKKKPKKSEDIVQFETLAESLDPIDHDEEPQLVIADTVTDGEKKKKKNSGTKLKKKIKTEINSDSTGIVPPEGDIAALSAKVTQQVVKKKKSEFIRKPKKLKRPPTAYTLWCNAHRTEVLQENPKMDFAQMSRRLGVIWQGLSKKEKMCWKRKAKKLAGKGSTLISTGKIKTTSTANQPLSTTAVTVPSQSLHPSSIKSQILNVVHRKGPIDDPISMAVSRGLGTDPVDVAAHLKLMGESLCNIGMRLQETKGNMAVQGGLSVLLDSLICACGPLMCLTQQMSELNGCDRATHAKTLDNIAYIMPGL